MENARKFIGANVRRLVDKRDITYQQAAEKMGMSLSFLNQIMKGQTAPSAEMIFQMAKGIACRPEEFFIDTASDAREMRSDLILSILKDLVTLNEHQLRFVATLVSTSLEGGAKGLDDLSKLVDKNSRA